METVIVVKESFYDGVVHIEVTAEENKIVRKVYLGSKNTVNNLYARTRGYIDDYNDTIAQYEKSVRLDNIKEILCQFDKIKAFCKSTLSPNDELMMEEEFETLHHELKIICKY